MKLYTYESMEKDDQLSTIDEELQDIDVVASTLDLLSLTEEKLDNDFNNAYTSIDMLSLLHDKVAEFETRLISEPVASKYYLTIYSLNENFIKAIGKNLGCQKPIVTLEDYRVALNKDKIHEVTMEGLKDIIITIWEKIKAFFRSLFEKIMLFVRRLIGLEPQFQYLEKYIENNIAKIKSRNLVLMDKNQKVETNIVKYLSPYDLSNFSENHIWTIGVPKINRFIDLIEDMIKYSKTANEAQIINNIKKHIEESTSKSKTLLIAINNTLNQLKNIKFEDIGDQLVDHRLIDGISKTIDSFIELLRAFFEAIANEIKTDELLATTMRLNFNITENENPYQEVVTAIEALKAKINVEDNNDIIIKFLYNCSSTTYTTPNILNLNIYSIVANGVPQSDIMSYSDTNTSTQDQQDGKNQQNNFIKYKYSDYGVVKYPTTYNDTKLFYAISEVSGIDNLFNLYKKIKKLPIDNVYKTMKTIEDRIEDSTKAFDKFIEVFGDIIKGINEITGILSAFYSKEENKKKLDQEHDQKLAEAIKALINGTIAKSMTKLRMDLIKIMEYHRRNITNSTGRVMAELISIRASFLRDLGYYIYRSTEKYS